MPATAHPLNVLEAIYYAVGILALLGGAGVIRLLMRISGVFTSIIGRKATPWRQEIPSYLEQIQDQGRILSEHSSSMGSLVDSVGALTTSVAELSRNVADLHLLTEQLRAGAADEATRVTDVAAAAAAHLLTLATARAEQVEKTAVTTAAALPTQ